MSQTNTCPSCGASITPESRFCPLCGKPVQVDANTPPSMPIVSPESSSLPSSIPQEGVVSVIGMVTRKTGIFSSELYHMVITEKRLILALQTREDQANDVKKAREKAKQEGKNLLGQIGAQMATRSGEKYLNTSPDLILRENPKNFAFSFDDIIKVSVFSGDSEDNSPDSMEIKTAAQKMKFTITNAYHVEKQLKQVLGSKVH